MSQPLTLNVENGVVSVKFDAAAFGIKNVKAVSAGQVDEQNLTQLLMEHDVVVGVALLDQRTESVSTD